MRESRTYGSVRGARGNSRPYRELKVAYSVLWEIFPVISSSEFREKGAAAQASLASQVVSRSENSQNSL